MRMGITRSCRFCGGSRLLSLCLALLLGYFAAFASLRHCDFHATAGESIHAPAPLLADAGLCALPMPDANSSDCISAAMDDRAGEHCPVCAFQSQAMSPVATVNPCVWVHLETVVVFPRPASVPGFERDLLALYQSRAPPAVHS